MKKRLLSYGMRAGDYIKIGRSTKVEQRLPSVQTGCPFHAEVFFVTDMPERDLHDRLAVFAADGGTEWFRFNGNFILALRGIVGERRYFWSIGRNDLWGFYTGDPDYLFISPQLLPSSDEGRICAAFVTIEAA